MTKKVNVVPEKKQFGPKKKFHLLPKIINIRAEKELCQKTQNIARKRQKIIIRNDWVCSKQDCL